MSANSEVRDSERRNFLQKRTEESEGGSINRRGTEDTGTMGVGVFNRGWEGMGTDASYGGWEFFNRIAAKRKRDRTLLPERAGIFGKGMDWMDGMV